MVCYVCLEECDQQSPCKCQTEIHKSCLIQMQLEMPHKNCTICHLPLKINFKTVDETDTNDLYFLSSIIWSLSAFIIYVVGGWIGKIFALIIGWIKVYSFEFWSFEHLISFMCFACFISIVAPRRTNETGE